MIFLFTDFGREGPYLGQVEAVVARRAPGHHVIALCSDAPAFMPQWAAYLLPAYATVADRADVVVAVVDPGVGSDRAGVALEADGRWFVGPDNGLFAMIARRATDVLAWRLPTPPATVSATFHGRDVFAPMAADIAVRGRRSLVDAGAEEITAVTLDRPAWPDDLGAVIYVDRFGNAMTGLRASTLSKDAVLITGGHQIRRARTYDNVPPGQAFWYANSNGLVEIAVNRGRASEIGGAELGAPVTVRHS